MTNYIYVGKIVGTHGIKGELKIISDEVLLDKIFKINNNLYIGDDKKKYVIATHRLHKNYNLVSFIDYQDINLIDKLLKKDIYIDKNEVDLDNNEYFISQLIDCRIIDDADYGTVIGVEKGKNCNYLRVLYNKEYLIPIIDEYIKSIDCNNKQIIVKNVKSLIL